MSTTQEIALMAHLMRRAGFGADRDALEQLATRPYEDVVEELVDPPDSVPRADTDLMFRYLPSLETGGPSPVPGAANWLYHMINTQRPLEEKMAFFWHHVFATGNSKVDNDNHLTIQVDMFREHGLGNYRDLLLRIAGPRRRPPRGARPAPASRHGTDRHHRAAPGAPATAGADRGPHRFRPRRAGRH